MLLRGKLAAYGLGVDHFYIEVHPLSLEETDYKKSIILCRYKDDLLDKVKSPDKENYRFQHILGKNIEVSGTPIDERSFKVDSLTLL